MPQFKYLFVTFNTFLCNLWIKTEIQDTVLALLVGWLVDGIAEDQSQYVDVLPILCHKLTAKETLETLSDYFQFQSQV